MNLTDERIARYAEAGDLALRKPLAHNRGPESAHQDRLTFVRAVAEAAIADAREEWERTLTPAHEGEPHA